MVIHITCPQCSSSFPVDPAKVRDACDAKGTDFINGQCPQCGEIFRIDRPAEPAPEPVAAPDAPAPEAAPEASPFGEPLPAGSDVAQAPAAAEEKPAAAEEWPAAPDEGWAPGGEDAPPPWEEPGVAGTAFADAEAPSEAPGFDEPAASATPPLEPMGDSATTGAGSDPFAEPAPFEQGGARAGAETEPAAEPAPAHGFTFGKRDPTDKAKRLARVLVSDMIMYNAERHRTALAGGTLVVDFEEEIEKSWKEYVEQVGEELAGGEGRRFWTEALNDILAKGQQVF